MNNAVYRIVITLPKMQKAVTRRSVLVASAGAIALVAAGPAKRSQAALQARRPGETPKTFFVDPSGTNDAARGTTPSTAWRTVGFVNACLASGVALHGDTILFMRGAWFAGGLTPPEPVDPAGPLLTFGAYGEGARPTLSAMKNAVRWRDDGGGIWSLDLSQNSGDYDFNTESAAVGVGFVRVDGQTFGAQKQSINELVDDWDFVNVGSRLYVRSTSNPTNYRVGLAVDEKLIAARSSLVVSDLALLGTGSHAFQTGVSAKYVTLQRCVVDLVGGSVLSGSTSRYGNGVEVWIGAEDVLISDNSISNVYDTATTLQGTQTTTARGWRNVSIQRNSIEKCTQSFEHWSSGSDLAAGSGAVACSFESNTCTGAGRGWGADARSDKAGKSSHLLFYAVDLPVGLSITRNTFRDAAQAYTYFGVRIPTELVSDHNTIEMPTSTRLTWQRPELLADATAWSLATGLDRASSFGDIR